MKIETIQPQNSPRNSNPDHKTKQNKTHNKGGKKETRKNRTYQSRRQELSMGEEA